MGCLQVEKRLAWRRKSYLGISDHTSDSQLFVCCVGRYADGKISLDTVTNHHPSRIQVPRNLAQSVALVAISKLCIYTHGHTSREDGKRKPWKTRINVSSEMVVEEEAIALLFRKRVNFYGNR